MLQVVFTTPWFNTLSRGIADYESWKERNPLLDDLVYIYGGIEHENFSELDKLLPPRLMKSMENLVTMSWGPMGLYGKGGCFQSRISKSERVRS